MSLSYRPTTIPPSPTSPPELGLKRRRLSDNLPQSPVSPSYMSVATKSYVSSYSNTHNPDEAAGRSTPSSPRGSTSRSQQTSRPNHSLPTPAHSIAGTNSGFDMVDDTDQHRDKRQRVDPGKDEKVDSMEMESITEVTNHDRNDEMEVDIKEKGAASEGAAGLSVDEKTLEQLQEDMGDAFFLCRSSKTLQSLHHLKFLLADLLTRRLQKSSVRDPIRSNICSRCTASVHFYTVSLAQIRGPVRKLTNSASPTRVRLKASICLGATSL